MANTLSRAQGEAIVYQMNNLAEKAHASGVSLKAQHRLEEQVEKLLQQLKDGGRTYEYTPNVPRPWTLFLLPGEESAPTINYPLARQLLVNFARGLDTDFKSRTDGEMGDAELDDVVARDLANQYAGYLQCVRDLYLDVTRDCPDPAGEEPIAWNWSQVADATYLAGIYRAAAQMDAAVNTDTNSDDE